jgi:outer membrane lipoprotein-sorting protein
MTRNQLLGAALILIAATLPMRAQKESEASANVMMQNVAKGFAAVQDFTVSLSADVDMERVRVPKMTATLYYKKPDKVHVESPNFAMLPREGIVLNPSILSERYRPTLKGKEEIEGRELYRIALTAREARIRPAQLTIWIDRSNWTIARMESAPYQGRSLKLSMTHELHEGSMWLPRTLVASFESAVRDTTPTLDLNVQGIPEPDQPRRPPRSGKITVQYTGYKINTGLSDDLFEKKEPAVRDRKD